MPDTSYRRGIAPTDSILASQPVSGSDWTAIARLQNHLASRGRVLVPAMRPDHTTLTKVSYTYAFWLVPTYNALVRRWRVAALGDGSLSVSANGGTAVVDPEPGIGGDRYPRAIIVDEVLGSQTATESAGTLELDSDGDTMVVESIECFELPRAFIEADANERGVNPTPFRSSQPIRAAAFTNIYAGANDPNVGRRVLFQWAVPYALSGSTSTTFAASRTSSTFTNMFGVAKPCLARKVYNTGKYRTCSFRVFAWVSGGGSGQVRVSSYIGNSAALTITSTTPAWSSAGVVEILSEDLTEDDGIPADGWDNVQIQTRAISGAIYVASALVYG